MVFGFSSSTDFMGLGVVVAGWWLFEAFLPAYLLKKFAFSSAQIGTFLASMGATYALFQLIVVGPTAKHMKAENMVRYSLFLSATSVLVIAFINNVIALHVAITVFVMSMGFALPGLITSISNLASKEQGKVMGNISSIQALATVIVMMIGGYIDTTHITMTIIGCSFLLLFAWLLFVFFWSFKGKFSQFDTNNLSVINKCSIFENFRSAWSC